MKKLITLMIICLMITSTTFSQVGINTDGSAPDASAMLDVKSPYKGLLLPRMTTAQRNGITSPVEGLIVYDTDLGSLYFYRSGLWNQVLGTFSGWSLKGNAGTNPSTDFLGTTDNKALVFRFNNIASGLINSTSTFFGYTAGKDNTGINSTLIGSGAGWKVSTGNANTALGFQALRNTTSGISNIAIGVYSLFNNINGQYNVATGHQALYYNSSGEYNTANGASALNDNTTGSNNTAIGSLALYSNTTGYYNTGLGSQTNVSAVNLTNATAIGYATIATASNQVRLGNNNIKTLFCQGAYEATSSINPNMTVDEYGQIMRSTATLLNGTGTANQVTFWSSPGVLSGNDNLFWNNASARLGIGTALPSQQLEITGAFQLPETTSSTTGVIYKGPNRFIHNYKPASNSGLNIFIGTNAGNFTMSGPNLWDASYNTGVGEFALNSVTSGSYNSAVGSYTLKSDTTGSYNTAVGYAAMYGNSSGNGNTATGVSALNANTTGDYNSGFGVDALTANTTGDDNAAMGAFALENNTIGSDNTAAGYYALAANTTANRNTAIGKNALYTQSYNNGGESWYSHNVAVGYVSLYQNQPTSIFTGTYNTAVGNYSLYANTTGSNNTAIGYYANVSSGAFSNSTAIGANALVSASNQVRLGNSEVTTFFCKGATATSSFKPNMVVDANGQIMQSTVIIPSGSGTTNQVAFWSGSGVLSGNNNLYWDNSTSRLGIGTIAPNQQLEVRGGNLLMSSSGPAGEIRFAEPGAGGSNYTAFKAQNQTLDITYSLPTADGLNGNVLSTNGAGILSWITPSDITAVGSMTSGNTFADATADDNWLGLGVTAGRIEFDDLTTDEVNILSANVGIGTATPSQKLEVKDGNLLLSNSGTAGEFRFAEPSGGGTSFTAFKAQSQGGNVDYTLPAAYGANGNVLSTTSTGILSWITPNAGDITAVGSMTSGAVFADATATGDWLGLGSTAGRIAFDDQATDYVNIMSANVGIGTLTPGQQLEITGNFELPATTSIAGTIYSGTSRFLHNFGTRNVFLGKLSGNFNLTNAYYNTGIGDSTLYAITTGDYNVAMGLSALSALTTASGNTVIGVRAGISILTSGYNTIVGYQAGKYTTMDRNTFIGCEAGLYNTTGIYNVFLGHQAGCANTTGNNSTALGYRALYIQTGFVGYNDLNNTAVGFEALYSNNPTISTDGRENVAVGHQALRQNQTGFRNTAIGSGALYSNIIGKDNTALGNNVLNVSLGDNNTGLGQDALMLATSGENNTAVGTNALYTIVTGSNNTAVGYNAGSALNNITNTTVLGSLTYADASNQVRLGNSSITSLYCHGAYVGTVDGSDKVDLCADYTGKIGYAVSSARYKDNISDMEDVDWLYSLRPVNFTYKSDEIKKKQYGLIAEEVEKVNPDFVHYNSDGLVETVSYSQLISPMIKAIQEQQALIEELQKRIVELEAKLSD